MGNQPFDLGSPKITRSPEVLRWLYLHRQWDTVQREIDDNKGGPFGHEVSEFLEDRLDKRDNLRLEILALERKMLRLGIAPPRLSVPSWQNHQLRRLREAAVFAFDTIKPTRKQRFKVSEDQGASAFPVTVSWSSVPVGSDITENESVTLTGEGVFNLPGVGTVTVPSVDAFGNYEVVLNAPGGDVVVWTWGAQTGWEFYDSEYWLVTFS